MPPAPHDEESHTERSPLLGKPNQPANGQIVDNEQPDDQTASAQDDEVVLAEEPSTNKLMLTMGSIWVGVFFAALGTPCLTLLSAWLISPRYHHHRHIDRTYLVKL